MGNKFGKLILKHKIKNLDFLKNKVLVIDGSIYLYKFSAVYRQNNGDLFKNKNNRVTSHLYGLLKLFCNLLSKNVKIIFVVDGAPHLLKINTSEKRKFLKDNASKYGEYLKIINSTNLQLIKSLKQKSFKITQEMYTSLEQFLDLLGIPFIRAKAEGEAQCAWFIKNKIADFVLSDDWDLLLYDVSDFYRNLSVKDQTCDYINIPENLNYLSITKQQLIDAIILSGTDYNKALKRVGPITALKLIKEYEKVEKIVNQKYDVKPLYEVYIKIKEYLQNYDVYEINKITFQEPKFQELEIFLSEFCNFSQSYILENLKLLLN